MSQISVVQILIQFCYGFVYSFSKKINLCSHRSGFTHTDFSGSCFLKRWSGDHWLVNKLQIGKSYFRAENTHLYIDHTLGVWFGTDRAFYIQA